MGRSHYVARQRLRLLDAAIDERLRRAAQASSSAAVNLPAHNRNFVGRHDELRQLREENRKLKMLVADLTLDKHILQEVLSKKPKARGAPGSSA